MTPCFSARERVLRIAAALLVLLLLLTQGLPNLLERDAPGTAREAPAKPTAAAGTPSLVSRPDDALAHAALSRVAQALGVSDESVEFDERLPPGSAYAHANGIRVSPALALDEALLRYVLAHELAHRTLGHATPSTVRELPSEVLRQREFDADALAVSRVCSTGPCDVEVFARLLEKTGDGPEHPSGVERAARVRTLGSAWRALGGPSGPGAAGFEQTPPGLAPAADSFLARSQPR